jgi:hypothetical protein
MPVAGVSDHRHTTRWSIGGAEGRAVRRVDAVS